MTNQKIIITELNCYPVKSCSGIALTSATLGPLGIPYDRQWMVVDENGTFVAQRGDATHGAVGIKSMCLITPTITPEHLVLNAPGMSTLSIPLSGSHSDLRTVRIWGSLPLAMDEDDEAAAWFTEYLSREIPGNYRLVKMPNEGTRITERGDSKVGFADAYPFLLTSEETLASLNALMDAPVPMTRFRPNIVMRGGESLMEDTIKGFSIRETRFTAIKRSGRCPITTIDQQTGIAGKEPLKTLATFNKEGNNVYFGMYLIHAGEGTINVGDELVFD